ncbi:hypothetical protein [uncultured Psychroserpens sp.]|uniref:hypothetical protein n=1 Tax=uncultured Psychroserpens sp. TaxID=255436 RepID=UPI002639A9C7|nr:hypothetical protein [uncultured Psychroserpens sp.]
MKNLKNLGKTLNKIEQKEIFGGMLTHYDPNCDDTETYVSPGCPCFANSQCANMQNPDHNQGSYDPLGGPNQNGSVFVQGTCVNGGCVA